MEFDRGFFVDRGIDFYRAVASQQRNGVDTKEKDCMEKRGFPSFDVYSKENFYGRI